MTIPERILSKFEVRVDGCWHWTAAKQPTGYGTVWNGARPEQAHRVVFRLSGGEIPEGCEIDHICRNRSCVNPAHLRAVPHRENMRVSDTEMGRNAAKMFCKRGHPFAGENLSVTSTGARQCRECLRLHARNARARRKQCTT